VSRTVHPHFLSVCSYEQLREIIRTDCTSTLWASSPLCFIRAPVAVVVGDDVVAVLSPPVPDGALTRPVIWTEWPTCGDRSDVLFSIQVDGVWSTGAFAALVAPLVPVALLVVPGLPGVVSVPSELIRAFLSSYVPSFARSMHPVNVKVSLPVALFD